MRVKKWRMMTLMKMKLMSCLVNRNNNESENDETDQDKLTLLRTFRHLIGTRYFMVERYY